jgi:2-polyprenyl-3-methyl-5-hydroxy-6-metoxy-1,4-benzoquinol methylase
MKSEPVTAIEHYETFLAQHYTWMSGSFADKVIHQHDLLTRSGVVPTTSVTAVDLACGPGAQSIALAQLGFSVIAIDANRQMLEELKLHAGNLQIRPVLHTSVSSQAAPRCLHALISRSAWVTSSRTCPAGNVSRPCSRS